MEPIPPPDGEMRREAKDLGLGPTGQFPGGKIHPKDMGEIAIAVGCQAGNVVMNFGTPVAWLAMTPAEARQLAEIILKNSDKVESMATQKKAAYVRSQGQTREHHCHWPGCNNQVPPAQWGCKEHWLALPKRLRDRIWQAYRPGQEKDMRPSREYVEAARAVQKWIEERTSDG